MSLELKIKRFDIRQINGCLKNKNQIDTGGHGQVYRIRINGTDHACKKQKFRNDEELLMILFEIETLIKLDHTNIIPISGFAFSQSSLKRTGYREILILMKYGGVSLARLIQIEEVERLGTLKSDAIENLQNNLIESEQMIRKSILSEAVVIDIMRQIISAVEYLHNFVSNDSEDLGLKFVHSRPFHFRAWSAE